MIYFDHNATFPAPREHLEEVFSKLQQSDGNPSSLHSVGRAAKLIVEESRTHIADALGAGRRQIIFTSGATEGNNTVLHSMLAKITARKPRILISATEHPSVYDAALELKNSGKIELFILPVNQTGIVDLSVLKSYLEEGLDLVSIMLANNETGVINNIQEIAAIVKNHKTKPLFHTDAVQGLGKLDLSWMGKSDIDFATFSAHKIGGLKGMGAIYAKDISTLAPLVLGGGQERGLRSGTENVPGIISFGLRCRDIGKLVKDYENTVALRQQLLTGLEDLKLPLRCNAAGDSTLPGTIHLSFPQPIDLGMIFFVLDQSGFKLSTGSACSSGKAGSSRVLSAMGITGLMGEQTLRVSLAGSNTAVEIDSFLSSLYRLLKK